MKVTNGRQERSNIQRGIKFILCIVTSLALMAVTVPVYAGAVQGIVDSILWSTWADDNPSQICFTVGGQWLHFPIDSSPTRKYIAAGLLAHYHTKKIVWIERTDTTNYNCGIGAAAYEAVSVHLK